MVERGGSSKKMWQTQQGQKNKWDTTLQKTTNGEWVTQNRCVSVYEIWNYIINLVGNKQTYTDG